MTFRDYLTRLPKLSPHERTIYLKLDQKATEIGPSLARRYEIVNDLRNRPGSTWMLAECNELCQAIERDPSGKLAAVKSLRAWVVQEGLPQTWVNWWVTLYKGYLDHEAI